MHPEFDLPAFHQPSRDISWHKQSLAARPMQATPATTWRPREQRGQSPQPENQQQAASQSGHSGQASDTSGSQTVQQKPWERPQGGGDPPAGSATPPVATGGAPLAAPGRGRGQDPQRATGGSRYASSGANRERKWQGLQSRAEGGRGPGPGRGGGRWQTPGGQAQEDRGNAYRGAPPPRETQGAEGSSGGYGREAAAASWGAESSSFGQYGATHIREGAPYDSSGAMPAQQSEPASDSRWQGREGGGVVEREGGAELRTDRASSVTLPAPIRSLPL